MILSKIQLSIPDICSDHLYCHVNNCLCGSMHPKTSKTSSADSQLHLEVPIDFCNIAKPFQFMITNFIDPPFHHIEYYLRHPQAYGTIRVNPSEVNNHWQHIQTVEHLLHHEKIKAIVTVSVPWITQRNIQELGYLTLDTDITTI